jgi:hypothetical protein
MHFSSSPRLLILLACAASVGCELQPCPKDDTGSNTEEVKQGNCLVLKSTKEYRGTQQVENTDWAPGSAVNIDATLGDVKVVVGTVDNQVSVTVNPFVRRPSDVTDAQLAESFADFEARVGTDTDGTVQVLTLRKAGSNTTLGGDVIVEVPQGFDGALTISNKTGKTDVSIPSVTAIDIHNTNGGITASFGAIGDGATGGPMVTDLGDVILGMPSDGTYYVGATAAKTVDFGTPPGACVEDASNGENSKSLTCNGATDADATFDVSADGVGGEVSVSYN